MIYKHTMDERTASLFQQDTLIPAQYLETFRRKAHHEPEKRLMLAVLEDAVACFQKYVLARDNKGKGMFCEAEGWILRKESDELFSFENICHVLGFNPQYIRRGLMRWKGGKLARGRGRSRYTLRETHMALSEFIKALKNTREIEITVTGRASGVSIVLPFQGWRQFRTLYLDGHIDERPSQ